MWQLIKCTGNKWCWKVFLIIAFVILSVPGAKTQGVELTLDQVVRMARQQSFEAFQAKNLYMAKELNFYTYKRLLFPKVKLSLTPANYDRSITEQWDSEEQAYRPFEVQRLTSYGDISLAQNVGLTGGKLSFNSSLRRSMTYNENSGNEQSYISAPLSVTYSQDFASVNTFKWRAKTDPVEFEEAKQQYLEDVESASIKGVNLFFSLLMAEMNYKIALLNMNNADTLCVFGRKKLEIGAIGRDEYLKLQLKQVNAGISLESRKLEREAALLELCDFLELPVETQVVCLKNDDIPQINISADMAINKVMENNPDMIALQRKLTEAQKSIKAAKTDGRSASFSASIGLNQNQDHLQDAYLNLRDRQSVYFTLSVPIIDWGDHKRSVSKARLNQQLVEETNRKQKEGVKLDVINMVKEFNIKQMQVKAAAQADSIARVAYGVVNQQFLLGKAGVLDINSSYNDMQSATNNYLSSLCNFWVQMYSLRKLCLYDFEKGADIVFEDDLSGSK